jgi:hypothetical protein
MFTLIQLRKVYDAIFMREFDPGNFRKKILSLGVLERLDLKNASESKKGAFYYKVKTNVDETGKDRSSNFSHIKINYTKINKHKIYDLEHT